ncbi:MAG: HD domain-containing protein [Alphaproteobacteria bacterium]|nr:HD domain-containing protein [Alphaproteobacteria bacterium]
MQPVIAAGAAAFAAQWHAGQWRKSFIRRPATEHMDWVVWILARYADASDEVLLSGGRVHDVLEDTDATVEHIAEALGWEVAHLAVELKNPDDLHGPDAKRIWQVAHAPHMSPRAKGIKIADQIAVVLEQLFYPHGKTLAHYLEYVDKAEAVCQACAGAYAELDRYAAAMLSKVRRQLENLMEATLDDQTILREPVITFCLHLACAAPEGKAEPSAMR